MISLRFVEKHNKLLQYLDDWFRSLQAKHADRMQCGPGCARCCHGLFDVSLPDALRIAKAFGTLPAEARSAAANRASAIQAKICQEAAELRAPFFLNAISQDRIDQLAERIQDVRCPLLDERNSCRIYDHRPLACRLEGIPMVDSRDGPFSDWCELNFKEGVSAELAEDFRLDYYEIHAIEQEVTEYLSQYLLASRQEQITLFIPSVIDAFDGFWKFHASKDE
jgi:Fe-S-cluster containining protein